MADSRPALRDRASRGASRVRLLAGLLLGLLAGCSTVTPIQDIQAHPHRSWFTATVDVQGTVGDRVPLIGGLVYQLRDPTGTIWVLTHRSQQPAGETIEIKGIVRFQSIPIAGQEHGEAYIEEEQVLHPHDRATHP